MRTLSLWTTMGLLLAAACTPTADEAINSDVTAALAASPAGSTEGETEARSPTDPTLGGYSNSTYFIVTHPDLRRCVYPLCGGFFTKRVNQATTTCSDGAAAPECRILEFDYSALGLSTAAGDKLKDQVARGQALLRGQITKTAPIMGKTYDKLIVQEAWEARGAAPAPSPTPTLPAGTFSRIVQLPVACPACPPYQQQVLNSGPVAARVAKLAFDPARFSTALVKDLTTALSASDVGLLFAGTRAGASGAPTFNVSEAYTPVRGGGGGKAGDLCGSRGIPAACETGLFCKRDKTANCGRADAAGVCSPIPMACIALYKPVCGCDNKTYGNECEAWHAGVSVDYDGVCR